MFTSPLSKSRRKSSSSKKKPQDPVTVQQVAAESRSARPPLAPSSATIPPILTSIELPSFPTFPTFPTSLSTPNPSPIRPGQCTPLSTPAPSRRRQSLLDPDLDPFNVSMETEQGQQLLSAVSQSYSYPFTRCFKNSPAFVCIAVTTCLLTAFAMMSYEPSSSVDFLRTYNEQFSNARFIDLTVATNFNITYEHGNYSPDGFIAGEVRWSERGYLAREEGGEEHPGTLLVAPAAYNEFGSPVNAVLVSLTTVAPLYVLDVSDNVVLTMDHVKGLGGERGVGKRSIVAVKGSNVTIGVDILRHLYVNLEIVMVATEGADLDPYGVAGGNKESNAWLAHNNFMYVTGLANLALVEESGCLGNVGVNKVKVGVIPVRMVAICPRLRGERATEHGNSLKTSSYPKRPSDDGTGLHEKVGEAMTDYCGTEGSDYEKEGAGCVEGRPVWWGE